MGRHSMYVCATALAALISFGATGVKALTMQECSANYKAAKSAGTLNGKPWSQFRKEECGSTAAATQPTAPLKSSSKSGRAAGQRQHGISDDHLAYVLQGVGRQGENAHLS